MRSKFHRWHLLVIALLFLITYVGCTCSVSDGYVYYDCNGDLIPCTDSTYDLGDAATYWDTLYVNNIVGTGGVGSGNVTTLVGGTTVGRVPYYTALRNIEMSGIFWDDANNRVGINDDTPSYALDVNGMGIHTTGDIDSDQDINAGNDLNCLNDLDVGDDALIGGTLTANNPHLNEAVNMTVTSTNLNLVDDADFIENILIGRRNVTVIPQIHDAVEVNVGSGNHGKGATNQYGYTGITANSSSIASWALYGTAYVTRAEPLSWFDWDNPFTLYVLLARSTSEAETTCYHGLRPTAALGDLNEKGVNIKIANLTLSGQSYGTGLGSPAGSLSLTNTRVYWIKIVFVPATSITWSYLSATNTWTQISQTTTANEIPTGSGGVKLVQTIANGATGGTNAEFYVMREILATDY